MRDKVIVYLYPPFSWESDARYVRVSVHGPSGELAATPIRQDETLADAIQGMRDLVEPWTPPDGWPHGDPSLTPPLH